VSCTVCRFADGFGVIEGVVLVDAFAMVRKPWESRQLRNIVRSVCPASQNTVPDAPVWTAEAADEKCLREMPITARDEADACCCEYGIACPYILQDRRLESAEAKSASIDFFVR
jgi:hypothetical protein